MTCRVQANPRVDSPSVLPDTGGPIRLLQYNAPIAWSEENGSITHSGFTHVSYQGKVVIGMATGNGPIDALFKATEDGVRQLHVFNGKTPKLEDWDCHSSGPGSDAPAVAWVDMTYDGLPATTRRCHSSSVHASMLAYVASLNELARRMAYDAPPAVINPVAPAPEPPAGDGPEGSD